jgi:tRNA threonylcarbamoyladenosine biosynthesis protein TsaB
LDFPRALRNLHFVMARLAQLLAAHGSILVLDAVSLRVQIGLLRAGTPALWQETGDEAGRGLFTGTQAVLDIAALGIADIGAFVFCEGPGSMLGTRTVAMALRTWNTLRPRPVFGYRSLAAAGTAEWLRSRRPFAIIADARRESWHVQSIAEDGNLGALERHTTAELPAAELLTPAKFRVWSKQPAGLSECRYDLPALLAAFDQADLLHMVAMPDVFQHAEPDYKKWSAQPHSAETATRK